MVRAVTEAWRPDRNAFISPCYGFEPPGAGPVAADAGEAIGPAQRCEVGDPGNLIAEALLELNHE
jgi:hypothetical protein